MIKRLRTTLLIAAIALVLPFGAGLFGIGSDHGTVRPSGKTDGARETSKATTPEGAPMARAYECGIASYYADSLAGNTTASGQPYDPSKYTAAHKTLPFETKMQVVRTDNKLSVTVVVNDRGPFKPGRVTDISRAAAEKIGLDIDGMTDVCLYPE